MKQHRLPDAVRELVPDSSNEPDAELNSAASKGGFKASIWKAIERITHAIGSERLSTRAKSVGDRSSLKH